ncbi:CHAT domain-containing protein [Flammeovirga kamogawensis]|uniref:CHAT domain-containing protein n=1 Tax=Flammeovirga kamogawensis TaxID=373891 RepID=A0ABX8GWJ2_9BACT|nr:CHAT domain-containing protein [Flammeovirga kamogawensis]MBB6459627.1 CHAT domain-containing protein [Flammeovirga kamogawensis]QWG07310.1 CHAT domain-containing protein [Flammeovirga kamogawensis]
MHTSQASFSQTTTENYNVSIVDNYRQYGEMDKAEAYIDEWIESIEKEGKPNSIKLVAPLIWKGRIIKEKQEYTRAIKYLKQAIEIIDKSAGWMYPDYIIATNYLLLIYIRLGDDVNVDVYISLIETLQRKTIGINTTYNAHTLFNKGLIEVERKNYTTADTYFLEAIAVAKSIVTPFIYLRDYSIIEVYRAKLLNKQGKFDKAISILKNLETELELNDLSKSIVTARLLIVLSDTYVLSQRFNQAIATYKKAEKKAIEVYGTESIALANVWIRSSEVNFQLSNLPEVKNLLIKGINIYEKNGIRDQIYQKAKLQLASMYLYTGHYSQSKKILEEVGHSINHYGTNYIHYLSVKVRQLKFQDKFIHSELDLLELSTRLKNNYYEYLYSYIVCSKLTIEFNILYDRIDRAKQYLEGYKKIIKKSSVQPNLINLFQALVLKAKGDNVEALRLLNLVQNQIIEYYSEYHISLIQVKYAMAEIYKSQNKSIKVIELCDEIEEIAIRNEYAKTETYRLKAKLFKAEELIELNQLVIAKSQLEALTKITIGIPIIETQILSQLAYVNALEKNWLEAEKLIIKATNQRMLFYNEVFKKLSEEEKVMYLRSTNSVFAIFDTMIFLRGEKSSSKMIEQCYNIEIRYRNLLKNEAIYSKQKTNLLEEYSVESGLPNYIEKLNALRSRIAAISYMTKAQRDSLKINPVKELDRVRNLEKSLLSAANTFANTEDNKLDITWQYIQSNLSDNDVVVDIVRIKDYKGKNSKYFALIINKQSTAPQLVDLGYAKYLDKVMYNEYQNSLHIKAGIYSLNSSNDNVYNAYWKPIKKVIENSDIDPHRIFVSPHGIYSLININTLKNPETDKYVLMEDYIFLTTNTLNISSDYKQENIKNKSALLIGNPSFSINKKSKKITLDERDSLGFEKDEQEMFTLYNLPGTALEIENVEKQLLQNNWDVSVLLGEQAREEGLLNLNYSPGVLHIATHGFFDNSINAEYNFINKRLLKSGLYFSEIKANNNSNIQSRYNSGTDGILTAYEVRSLNLDSTELVILSACQTENITSIDDDGISALLFAFNVAGAKSVIMSLWSVDDYATQQLMTTFYKKWLICKDRDQAFREAQVERMGDSLYKDPYFWGGFVLIN